MDPLAGSREEVFDPSSIIAGTAPVVTDSEVVAASQTIDQFAPLGRVTASGLLIESVPGASDGSQVPVAIAVHAIDTTDGAAAHPVYKGGQFNEDKVVWHASWTAAQKAGAFDGSPIVLVSVA